MRYCYGSKLPVEITVNVFMWENKELLSLSHLKNTVLMMPWSPLLISTQIGIV